MRFHTMAWFYSARGQLVHINYLQFDHKTPNRFPGPNFGGTDIERFGYKLERETHMREKTIVNDSPHYGRTEYTVPYTEDVVMGTVTIGMKVNYFTTELLGYLTRGEPLSKIVVRYDTIEDNGQTVPYMQYTFKECRLFEHETKAKSDAPQTFNIQFTYCCAEIHCYDGNLFATHKRCTPTEPEDYKIRASERSELYAQEDAARTQEKIEAARLSPTPVKQTEGTPVIHRFDVTAASEFNGETVAKGALNDVAFHIVEEAQSTDSLIDFLFENPNDSTRSHFKTVNKHLAGGVTPGQMVFLTPAESTFYKAHADFLVKEAYKVDSILASKTENIEAFAKAYTKLGEYAGMGADGASHTTNFFKKQTNEIVEIFNEIEHAYTTKHRMAGGTLREAEFLAERAKKVKQIEALLKRLELSDKLNIDSLPWLTKQMDLNRKSVERSWRNFNTWKIPSFSEHFTNAAKFDKMIKNTTFLSITFGLFYTHTVIENACRLGNEEACKKAKYLEWAAFAGELAVSGGGASAMGVLGRKAGLSGVKLLWLVRQPSAFVDKVIPILTSGSLAIAGGVGGGMGGSLLGKKVGDALYYLNNPTLIKVEMENEEIIWISTST